MTSVWPAAADTFTSITGTQIQGRTSPTHSGHHDNSEASILAMQQRVGHAYCIVCYGGAVGDGVADDTVAVQKTVTAASAAISTAGRSRRVYCPAAGGYKLTAPITSSASDILFAGDSAGVSGVSRFLIAHNGDGFTLQDGNGMGMEHISMRPLAGFTPTALIHFLCTQGNNINRLYLFHIRCIGLSLAAAVGIWVEFSGTTSGGIFDCDFYSVNVTGCTINWRVETSALASFNQKIAQLNWHAGICDTATTGFYARNCGFFNFYSFDNAGCTVGWDMAGVQVVNFDGVYSAGHGTEWVIGGIASGQTSNWIWKQGNLNDENTFFTVGGSARVAGNQQNMPLRKGGYGPSGRSYLGRSSTQQIAAVGASTGCYEYTEKTTSTNNNVVNLARMFPEIDVIATNAAARYNVRYRIVGQATGGGNGAGYTLEASFKVVNAAGVLTCTKIGATTVVSSWEDDAAWNADIVIDGTTGWKASVNGKAADGAITWQCRVDVAEVIQV